MKFIFLTVIISISCKAFSQKGPAGVEQTNGSSALELWLKADDHVYSNAGITLASNGNGVYQWNDNSGFARHIQQTSLSNQPIYTTGVLNSLPVLSFTASNSNYLGPLSIDAFQNNYSIFIVGYTSGITQDFLTVEFPGFGILLEGGPSNSIRHIHRNPVGTLGGDQLFGGTTRSLVSPQIISFTRGTPGAGNQQFWIDGSDNQTISASDANFTSSGTLYLARLGSLSQRYLNGDMAEVIVFSKEVNSVEKIIIENYLSAKYGLTMASNDIYTQDNLANGDFDHEVAGIGRLDALNLQNDAQGTGIVRILNPSSLDDNEFLIWGHNNGVQQATETVDVPAPVQARFDRVWRVSEVSASLSSVDVGSIDLRFDLTGLGSVTASDIHLLIDTDNDGFFNDETPISGATSIGGNIYEFSGVSAIANNLRFTLGTTDTSQTPLPIELIYFRAIPESNRTVKLEWQTASEINNDYFTIERSKNGKDWEVVKTVNGAGKSSVLLSYSAMDNEPYSGVSYYRLKQTDFDGKFEYSKIKSVNLNNSEVNIVEISPNPTNNIINVIGNAEELQAITIINPLGQDVTNVVSIINEDDSSVSIDLSKLSQGAYYLKTKTTASKVYKQ